LIDYRRYFTDIDLNASNLALAAGVALLAYLAIHTALVLFRRRLCRISENDKCDKPVAEMLKATLARSSHIIVIATSILIGLSVLELPSAWSQRVRHLWFITLGIQLALYLSHAIDIGSRRYFRKHSQSKDRETLTVANTLTVWALKTVLWVVFGLALLSNLGINVTTFIASLGIGGIAIALAVQNILGDLFASLSIAVDKPFEVGDAIAIFEFTGTVEHVGLKSTRIRSDNGEQIVIANAEMLKSTVRNFKRMHERRVAFSIKVNPETPAPKVARVVSCLKAAVEQQAKVRLDRAHLKNIDPAYLEFEVVYYVQDPRFSVYMDAHHSVMLAILESLSEIGVSTAAATQHVVLQRAPAALRSGEFGGDARGRFGIRKA
jgi:small-conductance mechanosensitive channel